MERTSEKGLKVRLFGRFEVWLDKKLIPPAAWPQRKTQTLLKVLLTERGRVFTQDQLIEYLFPELDPQKALKSLHGRISELRHLLEPGLKKGRDSQYILRVEGGGYCFSKEVPCRLDTEEFEKHCEIAQELVDTHRWLQALERYRRGIDLHRGPYLAEDLYEEWSLAPREHWRGIYLRALAQLAECQARLGQYLQAIDSCHRIIELEPYRESAYRAKMLYHYYAGERLEAQKTYRACMKVLKDELEVKPSQETQELYELILQGQVPPLPRVIPNNLPIPPTCFIGREAELAEMRKLLGDPSCRLLTLVGFAGIGKTRLALQIASEIMEQFPQGVYFIPLVSLSSPDLLVSAIASTLKFSFHGREDPKHQLLNYLREKKLLLILDGCELLLEGRSLLTDILRNALQLKLLITSRERINLQGEWLLLIEGLSFPRGEQVEDVEEYSAVQLFLCHATRVQPGFTLSPEEKPSVVRICQLLEGMPLGIELAAAWVRLLSCEEIAREIQGSLDFLATTLTDVPERHRSLRAVFDHSWRLLTSEERGVLQKLSVFRSGFTREATKRVVGASLSQLCALVDKSLVHKTASGRYEMHPLLQQYAEERLKAAGGDQQMYGRHSKYYAQFLQQRESTLTGPNSQGALEEISQERENIRAAWRWTADHRKAQFLQKALEGLFLSYELSSNFQEGEEAFRRAIMNLRRTSVGRSLLMGKLLGRGGYLSCHLGRYEQAKKMLEESLAIACHWNDSREKAFALRGLGLVALMGCEYAQARRRLHESLAIRRKIADLRGIARTLKDLGNVAYRLGEYSEAKSFYEESLASNWEMGDRWGIATSLKNLGNVAYRLGEYAEAKRLYEESLAISRELGDRFGAAKSLNNLGEVACQFGEYTKAKRLYQESLALHREIGDPQAITIPLNNLGYATHRLGEHAEAKRLYDECLAIQRTIGDRWGMANSLNNLGNVALALEEDQEAKAYLHEGLKTAMEIQAAPVAFGGVVGMAKLLAKTGQRERAVELLTCVFYHPAIDKETQDEAQQLLAPLRSELPPQVMEAAQRRGRATSLEAVVAELLSGPTC